METAECGSWERRDFIPVAQFFRLASGVRSGVKVHQAWRGFDLRPTKARSAHEISDPYLPDHLLTISMIPFHSRGLHPRDSPMMIQNGNVRYGLHSFHALSKIQAYTFRRALSRNQEQRRLAGEELRTRTKQDGCCTAETEAVIV